MVKINLMGDVMFAELLENYRRGLRTVLRRRGIDPFERARPALAEADFNLINLECVIGDASILEKPFSEILISPPESLRFLAGNNINVVNTANNHALDHGRRAFERSVGMLRDAGISVIGYDAGRFFQEEPVVLEAGGMKTGFLGYNISNFPEADRRRCVDRIQSVLAGSGSSADRLVVSMHWGEEYTNIPPPYVVEYGMELIEAGAGVLHGHHSHRIQGVLRVGGAIFAPSLGNFIFDQKVRLNRITAVLQVEMPRDGAMEFRYVPYYMNDLFQPEPAPEYDGYVEQINGYLRDCLDGGSDRYAETVRRSVEKGHRANRIRMRIGMLAHFWDYLPYTGRIIAFRRGRANPYSIIRDMDCLESKGRERDGRD
ncbi:MAG: CapA family protein [Candidatus Krumholzibacteria bacterium]|nr:CapA family protein [Candidatus Krumholzibacteria bacterium]